MEPVRVAVEKIKSGNLKLEEDIAASSWDLDSFDVKFVDNINITCELVNISKEILVHATVSTHRVVSCSRCLEQVKKEQSINFDLNYNIESLGEYLDIDDEIREQILINFPMKVLCKPDCRGICPGCGVNLNLGKCNCQVKPPLTS